MSYQKEVFSFISSIVGQSNTIAIPVEFVRFSGDYNTSALLTQLIYWQGKQHDSEGWIYKTYEEWEQELALSKYQVKRSSGILKSLGVLETKVMKIKLSNGMLGNTAVHYKFNSDVFVDTFGKHLNKSTVKGGSLPEVKKLNFEKSSFSTSFPLEQRLPSKTTATSTIPAPEPMPVPQEPPPQKTAAAVPISDGVKSKTNLFESVREGEKKPIVIKAINKMVDDGFTLDAIQQAILHSNTASTKPGKYKSFLDKCVREDWLMGCKAEDVAAELKEKKRAAFLKSRRAMPEDILKVDAAKGCKISMQVLKERKQS